MSFQFLACHSLSCKGSFNENLKNHAEISAVWHYLFEVNHLKMGSQFVCLFVFSDRASVLLTVTWLKEELLCCAVCCFIFVSGKLHVLYFYHPNKCKRHRSSAGGKVSSPDHSNIFSVNTGNWEGGPSPWGKMSEKGIFVVGELKGTPSKVVSLLS